MGRTYKHCKYCALLGESCRNFQYLLRDLSADMLRDAFRLPHGRAYLRLRTGLDVDLDQLTIMPPAVYYPYTPYDSDFPVYERIRVGTEAAHTCWLKQPTCRCAHDVTPWFASKHFISCPRGFVNSSKRTKKWKAQPKRKGMKKQFYNHKKFGLGMLGPNRYDTIT